jgi:hypothetical protein
MDGMSVNIMENAVNTLALTLYPFRFFSPSLSLPFVFPVLRRSHRAPVPVAPPVRETEKSKIWPFGSASDLKSNLGAQPSFPTDFS